jgi:hypothetical protein
MNHPLIAKGFIPRVPRTFDHTCAECGRASALPFCSFCEERLAAFASETRDFAKENFDASH